MSSVDPDVCQVALKEWSGVCAALAAGRQTILLRKGGIAERSGRFQVEHDRFWLYPTHVHERQHGLVWTWNEPADIPNGHVRLDLLAVVTDVLFIEEVDRLQALASEHVLHPETVLQRFHYRRPGLWVISVRIHTGGSERLVRVTEAQEGCKSWVPLEEPLSTRGLHPVLSDEAHHARIASHRRALTAVDLTAEESIQS